MTITSQQRCGQRPWGVSSPGRGSGSAWPSPPSPLQQDLPARPPASGLPLFQPALHAIQSDLAKCTFDFGTPDPPPPSSCQRKDRSPRRCLAARACFLPPRPLPHSRGGAGSTRLRAGLPVPSSGTRTPPSAHLCVPPSSLPRGSSPQRPATTSAHHCPSRPPTLGCPQRVWVGSSQTLIPRTEPDPRGSVTTF